MSWFFRGFIGISLLSIFIFPAVGLDWIYGAGLTIGAVLSAIAVTADNITKLRQSSDSSTKSQDAEAGDR